MNIDSLCVQSDLVLLAKYAKLASNGHVLEIGAWRGASTATIAKARLDAKKEGLVFSCDPHFDTKVHEQRGSSLSQWICNMYHNTCSLITVPLVCKSIHAYQFFHEIWVKRFAMIFIDGDHLYSAVRQDIELWTPYLYQGGYLIFDDATGNAPGVSQALNDTIRQNILFKLIETGERFEIYQKI